MITENYVSYEVAKLLKEKGFEQEPDYATSWYANQYYKNACQGEWFEGEHQIIEDIDDKCNVSYFSERGIFIPAPTHQMACKWLREEHNLFIFPFPQMNTNKFWTEIYQLSDNQEWKNLYCESIDLQDYSTYEEAVEAALKYCLENLI